MSENKEPLIATVLECAARWCTDADDARRIRRLKEQLPRTLAACSVMRPTMQQKPELAHVVNDNVLANFAQTLDDNAAARVRHLFGETGASLLGEADRIALVYAREAAHD